MAGGAVVGMTVVVGKLAWRGPQSYTVAGEKGEEATTGGTVM